MTYFRGSLLSWFSSNRKKRMIKDPRSWVPIGYSLVSYLKIAGGHAHTDCNSPLALVAALNETLMSNDNFKSALPLTILADLPFRIVGDRMTLSECGARATLIECCALSIFGLIIIAGFTRYTFLMSIFIYTNHSTSMAGPCITCCNKAYHS